MARKQKKRDKRNDEMEDRTEKEHWYNKLEDTTRRSIAAVALLVAGIFLSLSAFNMAGIVGNWAYAFFTLLFGNGYFLAPLGALSAGIILIAERKTNVFGHTLIGGGLFIVSSLALTDIVLGVRAGGYTGFGVSWILLNFFDYWISVVILIAILIVSLLIMLNRSILFRSKKTEEPLDDEKSVNNDPIENTAKDGVETEEHEPLLTGALNSITSITQKLSGKKTEVRDGEPINTAPMNGAGKRNVEFVPPPLNLLGGDQGKPSSGDIKANSNIIKRTLQNFGIEVEMDEISIGPSVTQFTLKPAEGIKISRILGLQNDLALALAAHPLRIEAPIPGKALVGIEIPNRAKTMLGLGNILNEDAFTKNPSPLLIPLGRDVTGVPVFADIAKMPHFLIAGATGSGKSITLHDIIVSLLYRNAPDSLRFLMIDPKRVELSVYNKIPHMLSPTITTPKEAVKALKWTVKEMERRYDILLKAGVRDVSSYHEENPDEADNMPYIMIIIDELADLMTTYPREIESSIVRIAQMARAIGIHLIVSTQRPSVEVITGLIKANIPSRVALQVASQIDSRTILDMAGAEKLLGKGDMLYLAGDSAKPRRIQAPFISETEIKRVVEYLAYEYNDFVPEEDGTNYEPENGALEGSKATSGEDTSYKNGGRVDIDSLTFDDEGSGDDELYEAIREHVIETQKASTSYLQRKFKLGYSRAARMVDMLEEHGVVGPQQGSRPRDVYVSPPDETINNSNDTESSTNLN